jgi:RHS repeat-associated protein
VNGAVQSERTSYFHKDYLGSINAITDAVGSVVEEFSFDPWGARRAGTSVNMSRTAVLSNWWRNSNRTTLRGFTGHEMVDGVDVINMNGRIYDAYIGRFLQADPIVQEPALIDNLNRYSYVLNNPLNATDPSGYVLNKLVRNFAKDMSHIFGAEVTYVFGATVATYIGGPYGAAYWDYQFNRAMGATSSQAFRSSATTFAVASASYYIGASGWEGYQKVFAHAVVGGLAAEAQGGDFVSGFFAAGVTKGFTETGGMASIPGEGFAGVMTRTAIAATIGGTVSEMTGGKFANGARTAAMQHLFNYETERARAAQKGAPITDAELELAKEGKFLEFWRSRHLAGDPVARTALTGWGDPDFVGASLFEKLAAGHTWSDLSSYISDNGLTVSMEQIGAELALAHANAVIGDGRGIANLLSPAQVADYHHSVFRGHGIPAHIFGGTHKVPFVSVPVQGGWGPVMFDANTYSGLWCKGCDSTP